jgi:hypothetical protein
MYAMDMRQYDPAIGRWVVQDPVVHYEYSPYSAFDNNPIVFADPSGADAWEDKDGYHFNGVDAKNLFAALTSSSSDNSEDENDVRIDSETGKTTVTKTNDSFDRVFLDGKYVGTTEKGYTEKKFSESGKSFEYVDGPVASGMTVTDFGLTFVGGTLVINSIVKGIGILWSSRVAAPLVANEVSSAGLTTVGRWMSRTEYSLMLKTGKMVEGAGGQTFVSTGGSEAFTAAAKGSVYVEFQVSTNSLLQGGASNWFKVIGPNSSNAMKTALEKQGGQLLPQVQNLSGVIKVK